ncbi:lysophospholipase catalytic domain-containing protein [Melampsora americana]|nr:lysophospholipase catalytic domain-containing protein [Melampsora americana]
MFRMFVYIPLHIPRLLVALKRLRRRKECGVNNTEDLYLWDTPSILGTAYNPSSDYAPRLVPCPKDFKARTTGTRESQTQELAPEEINYIAARRSQVLPEAYNSYISNVDRYVSGLREPGTVLPSYVSRILSSKNQTILPRMSFAIAGGAYRGAIFAAAVMNVFDGKNVTSASSGLGGVLNAADYITGLSGSAWLLVSWMDSELSPLFDLVLGAKHTGRENPRLAGWLTQYGLLNPTDALESDTFAQRMHNRWLQTIYWTRLILQVNSKRYAGFPIGIVDLWGRILSYHFLSGSNPDNFFNGTAAHGINQTFSDFVKLTCFKNHTLPFPILTALPQLRDSRYANFPAVPYNYTRYEITPYEFGSYDPFLSSFIPTKNLGTKLSAGLPQDKSKCCAGFDNAGFIMGMSSNIFTAYKYLLDSYFKLRRNLPIGTPEILTALVPNPFLGLGTGDYLEKGDEELHLIDGGLGLAQPSITEVTPYHPLLVKARKAEVIIAIDGVSKRNLTRFGETADFNNFANGSSVIHTARRAALYPSVYKFPKVPMNVTKFTTQGLVKRPTFFGCEEFDAPLVIWIANSAPIDGSTPVANRTTLQLTFPLNQTEAMMKESTNVGTRGFPSGKTLSKGLFKDPLWPACLSCAIVDRARGKLGVAREGLCSSCFNRYCWSEKE